MVRAALPEREGMMSKRRMITCDGCHKQVWLREVKKVLACPASREQGFTYDLICPECQEREERK
jgi:hypothetical protein